MILQRGMEGSLDLEFFVMYQVMDDDHYEYHVRVPIEVERRGDHVEYVKNRVRYMKSMRNDLSRHQWRR